MHRCGPSLPYLVPAKIRGGSEVIARKNKEGRHPPSLFVFRRHLNPAHLLLTSQGPDDAYRDQHEKADENYERPQRAAEG